MVFFSLIDGDVAHTNSRNICNCIIFTGLKNTRANTVIAETTLGKTVDTY